MPDPRTSVKIRAAMQEDLEFLVQGNLSLAKETEGLDLDRLRLRGGVQGLLDDTSRGFYLIAEHMASDGSSTPVGQLMITFEWSDWRDGTFWWIQSVYVTEAHRRAGVFRALYEDVLRRAFEAGNVCGVRLYVEEHNQRARATYCSLGMAQSAYCMYEVDFVLSRP